MAKTQITRDGSAHEVEGAWARRRRERCERAAAYLTHRMVRTALRDLIAESKGR